MPSKIKTPAGVHLLDARLMRRAIAEAQKAYARGDYPIGGVICTWDGDIVVAAGNRVKTKDDSTRHIELELIQYAVGLQHGAYLPHCVLYTTAEPCPMCAGAAYWAQLGGIVYGTHIRDMHAVEDPKKFYKWRTIPINSKDVCNGRVSVVGGFLRNECLKLLKLQPKPVFRSAV